MASLLGSLFSRVSLWCWNGFSELREAAWESGSSEVSITLIRGQASDEGNAEVAQCHLCWFWPFLYFRARPALVLGLGAFGQPKNSSTSQVCSRGWELFPEGGNTQRCLLSIG